jgi:hypothetical protein
VSSGKGGRFENGPERFAEAQFFWPVTRFVHVLGDGIEPRVFVIRILEYSPFGVVGRAFGPSEDIEYVCPSLLTAYQEVSC